LLFRHSCRQSQLAFASLFAEEGYATLSPLTAARSAIIERFDASRQPDTTPADTPPFRHFRRYYAITITPLSLLRHYAIY